MKIKLTQSSFTPIPEGVTTFKVISVDDSKFSDYGKLEVKLVTERGQKHTERFSFLKANGEQNEIAQKLWSFLVRACLKDALIEEADSQAIVEHYFTANVKHETYIRTKGENAGLEATSIRLYDYKATSGFESDTEILESDREKTDPIAEFLD